MESYLQASLERIYAAAYIRTFDDRITFMETLQQRATFRATVRLQLRGDRQGYALRRNINTVTMLTCDVSLRHFCKTMLYTVNIRVAYAYLLYTLDYTNRQAATCINPLR